jgi:hypothetical protein
LFRKFCNVSYEKKGRREEKVDNIGSSREGSGKNYGLLNFELLKHHR